MSIQLKKEQEKLRKEQQKIKFAKVNWDAHLTPLLHDFFDTLREEEYLDWGGIRKAFHNGQHNEDIKIAENLIGQKTVHFIFGSRRLPGNVVKSNKSNVASGAQLVFSQSIDGELAVLLYPPYTENKKPEKKYYFIGHFQNPGKISRKDVLRYFILFVDLQRSCDPSISSNAKCSKLFKKCQVLEDNLTQVVKSKGLLGYIKNIGRLIRIAMVYASTGTPSS